MGRFKSTEKLVISRDVVHNPEHAQFISIDAKPINDSLILHARQWVENLNKQLVPH
jgi:hypothetical protein